MLDANKYALRDKEAEKRYGFTLEQARKRAEKNRNRLLRGRNTIFCVETIRGGFEAFKSIVETNGGSCAMYRGRPVAVVGRTKEEEDSTDSDEDGDGDRGVEENEVYLISGNDKSHMRLWPKFRAMVRDAQKIPRIVRSEWLLEIAISQEWRWKDEWEWKEDDGVEVAEE